MAEVAGGDLVLGNVRRIDKLLATTGFIFITAALYIIAATPPATGYELSIYDAYPPYFWFFIVASVSCGITILVHQAFTTEEKSNWWLAGLCIVVFANAIFLGLPFFRGYAFYSEGDVFTHLGLMKDIMATGHIGSGNFYPVVHLLGVSLLDITGLKEGLIANLLFVSWSTIYLLNIYLLATVVSSHRRQALLITAFASPLIYGNHHTVLHPSVLSLFMVPLLLYFYHRRQNLQSGRVGSSIALILLVFAITFIHPVTALFVIAILLTFNLSAFLYRQIAGRKQPDLASSMTIAGNYNIALIMFIVFFMWYFSYSAIQGSIKIVYDWLVYETTASLFRYQTETLAAARLTPFQMIELFIYRYGPIVLYLFVSAAAVAVVLKESLSKKARLEPMNFTYAVLFIIGLAASAFSLWGFTGEFNPVRISRFFLAMAPIVSGLVIYKLVDYRTSGNLRRVRLWREPLIGLVAFLLVAAGILSIFNVYGSPRTTRVNWQVTRMEIAGTEWLLKHRDNKIAVASLSIVVHRFEDLIYGTESVPARAKRDPAPMPSHFGYDKNSSAAQTYDFTARYLLTCEADRLYPMIYPQNVRARAHQYLDDDFASLSADPTVSHLYTNGDLDVWRVYGE